MSQTIRTYSKKQLEAQVLQKHLKELTKQVNEQARAIEQLQQALASLTHTTVEVIPDAQIPRLPEPEAKSGTTKNKK